MHKILPEDQAKKLESEQPILCSVRAAQHLRDRLTVSDTLRQAMYQAVLVGGPEWGDT